MRVTLCVDALQSQLSGIGRYTWELCKALPRRDDIQSLYFYSRGSLIDKPSVLLSDTSPRRKHRLLRWMDSWNAKVTLGSTLVHGPNYFLPAQADKGVITVHDLSVLLYPETHPAERVISFERLFASSLDRSAHVITDSRTVRDELIELFSVPAERVSAVPLGVGPSFRPRHDSEIETTLRQWELVPGTYGLSVAAFEPRKQIAELIAAWRRLPDKLRHAHPLVLAGVSGWRNEQLHHEIIEAQAEGWLKNLGYVSDTQLPELYSGARLFIYPSIYEGFGLPPVEAMASGTPVIVANRSCLPEVCGDAAGYIDPADGDAFTLAIEEGLSNETWRSEIRLRGLTRASQYSWDRCIADTVTIYKRLGG